MLAIGLWPKARNLSHLQNRMKKILGLGNALVDIVTQLESDEILEHFNLPRGSMTLIDATLSNRIRKETEHLPKTFASGGSASNTIHGLARLGIQTGFVGKICNDKLGEVFLEDLKKHKITPHLFNSNTETGRAISLVSPDSERTFGTYLGAALELSAEDLHPDLFKGYNIIHIEGYLVQNHELLTTAVKMAKEKGLEISLDLASYNIVEENLDFLRMLVKNYVDILFANDQEAKSFTGMGPYAALDIMAKYSNIAIVKTGEKGSLIKQGNDIYPVAGFGVDVVDTTGAGDLYAAGFLYGLVKGLPLDQCGKIAGLVAGKVIEVFGAKIPAKGWETLRSTIKD